MTDEQKLEFIKFAITVLNNSVKECQDAGITVQLACQGSEVKIMRAYRNIE